MCGACRAEGSSGGMQKRSGARGRLLLPRPVRNTVRLRCEELLLLLPPPNADSVLPVGVVLDPSVRVVVRELRGRSGPATEKERDRHTEKKEREIGESKPGETH